MIPRPICQPPSRCLRVFASVFLALFFITELPAQTPAFPGALGNGAYVTGGRNGTVYHVTTLADSGAGSFREAVASGNRTVVFDVGGTIKLLTAVSARGNLTIAGQTAPGGIKFDGGEISFSARSNVICRFLRIRPGSDTASSTDDAIAFANGRSMIFDHCSIAFAPWNNVGAVSSAWQTTPVTDITFQHCINANPTGQQFGAHTESVSSDWTWCYNIFANSHNRNPLAKVNNVFINNIEYNCSAGYTTHTSTKFKHDLVNNYFVAGPASGGNFPWYQIDNNQSMYFTGNLYDSDKNGALNGSTTVPLPGYQGGGTVLNSPFSAWTSIIPTMSAALAWRYDLSAAGVLPRDEVDNLILSQIKTLGSGSTGTGAGTVGPGGGLYTSQTQTGLGNNGYGTLTGLAAPTDTDNDGMPDYWELATGSNPNAANPLTNTFTGYTLLENYLNYLAAPHVVTQTNTAVTLNLRQLTEGFSASATYSVTNATNGTVTLISGTNAVFTPAANFIGLGSFNFIVTEGSFSLNVAVTVCVTPVVPPDSAVAFNGALIGVSITTAAVVLPANLTWRGDSGANTWNTSVSNWFNGTGPAAFKNGDIVTFDDTGSTTPAVNLAAAVSPGAFIFDATNNYEIAGSGSLGGSMNLSKYGSGNLTLPNANTFSGGTILNEGTLVLSNLTSLGSGALTLNGGTLSLIAAGGPAIYANPVTVAAPSTIQITGPGNYNEAFNSAFTGSASLDFNIANANGATFSVRSGMTLSGYSGTIFIRGGGPFRWQGGTGSSTVAFDLGTNGAMITRDGGTIILGSLAGGPNTFLRGAGGSAVATTYIIGGKNLSTTFAGQITNGTFAGSPITTAIVKAGTGTLTLSGTNFHTAGTTISNGSLVVSGAINASAVTAVTAGQLTGTGYIGGLVSVNGGGKFSPGNGGPGTFNLGGGLTLNGGTVNFDFANTTTVGGGVNDLIALNGGALTFSGTSTINPSFVNGPLANGTYTLISGGAATVGSTANLTWGGPGGTRQTIALDTATTGALKLNVSGTPAASLVWRGTNGVNWDTATVNWANGGAPDIFYNLDAVTFDDTGVNAASVTLPAPVSPAAIVVNSSQNYTFSGSPITGSGSLTKLGSSTLTLANSNSAFAGTINVFGGTLSAAAGSSLGNGVMTISNGATLALPASGPSVFFGGAITVPANTTGTIISGGLANGISGNLFSGNSNSVLNLNGVSFGGTTSAQFDNFTGTINIQPGSTLRFSPNSSGNTFGSTVPTFVINGTLQPRNAGNTVVLGAFSGTGILASAQSASGTGDTLYVVGGNNSDANFSGNISSNSAVAGSDVDVTKLGTGTLTLSGSSTFGGGTTVSAGTLRVNNTSGSGTGTGDLEIFPGATLTGKGIIASATTLDGGATLAPGDPLGTLTFTTSLALSDSSILQFALGTNSDSVVVVGDLILTGQLQVTNAGGFGPGTYPLFTYGTLSYGNLVIASAPAGYNYTISTNTPGVVQLVVAPTAPPLFGNVSWSAGNLTLSGSNGVPSGNYWVQQSSNLVNWISIATNQFDASGGFSFTTNAPLGSPQNFFRLQLP